MVWEKWYMLLKVCGNTHLENSAQTFEQPLINDLVDYISDERIQDTVKYYSKRNVKTLSF
jgi:hypothetical protein